MPTPRAFSPCLNHPRGVPRVHKARCGSRTAERPPQSAGPRGNPDLPDPPPGTDPRCARRSRHVLPFGTVPPSPRRKRGRGGSEATSLATRSGSGSSWIRRREPGTSLPQVLLSPRRGCLGRELPRGEEQPLCPPFAQGALRQNSLGISHPGANPRHAHLVRLLTKPKLSLFKCKLRAHATSSAPQLCLARISLGEAAREHPEKQPRSTPCWCERRPGSSERRSTPTATPGSFIWPPRVPSQGPPPQMVC